MKCCLHVHSYDSNHSRSMKKPIFMYIYELALTMYVLVQYLAGMVEKTEYGVRSTEYGVRSTEYGVRSTECGVRSTESVSVKVFL